MPSKTVSKRVLKSARATLSQTQYNHKRAIIELEQERRAIRDERAEAIIALKALAVRYGINEFSTDQSLASIITQIDAQLPPPTPEPIPAAPPEPLSPTLVETQGLLHRATCACGWHSSWVKKEADAIRAAMAHEERLHT